MWSVQGLLGPSLGQAWWSTQKDGDVGWLSRKGWTEVPVKAGFLGDRGTFGKGVGWHKSPLSQSPAALVCAWCRLGSGWAVSADWEGCAA